MPFRKLKFKEIRAAEKPSPFTQIVVNENGYITENKIDACDSSCVPPAEAFDLTACLKAGVNLEQTNANLPHSNPIAWVDEASTIENNSNNEEN